MYQRATGTYRKIEAVQTLRKISLGVWLYVTLTGVAGAADQTRPGAGNKQAQTIGAHSPFIGEAVKRLVQNVQNIQNEHLRQVTLDGFTNPRTCVVHRANLTAENKKSIIHQLLAEGLLSAADGDGIDGGLMAGLFPPILDDGTACPHVALHFEGTPGSNFGSHHSYPGGLVVHESFNQQNARKLAAIYREIYAGGLAHAIDEDAILAAPVWHDWAKMLVFQWNADGTEFQEMNFGGLGKNDDFGKPGNSRTGAHHILSLAETMARGLPGRVIITQASAHSAPTLGNEYKVVNWIRAAAIIARVDPVAKGFLIKKDGELKLPGMRIEYQINNLSDADYVNSVPAVNLADGLLKGIAREFGYDPADVTRYNTEFRAVILARLGAERIEMVYGASAISGVEQEVRKLRQAKAF